MAWQKDVSRSLNEKLKKLEDEVSIITTKVLSLEDAQAGDCGALEKPTDTEAGRRESLETKIMVEVEEHR